MNNTLQTKTEDKNFRPVLADFLEERENAADPVLVHVGQRENILPSNGESKLFSDSSGKSNPLMMDSGQEVPVRGVSDNANKETLFDRDIQSAPAGKVALLYRLFGDSQGDGVVSDSNAVAKSIGDGSPTSDSVGKTSYTDSHREPPFLFPENLKQMETETGQFRFVQNGIDEPENPANELAPNSFEDAEKDESLQPVKLSQVQSLRREAAFFPEERVHGNVHELSVAQHLNQTLSANSDTKQFISQNSWEAEKEGSQNSPAPKTGQSVSMACSTEDHIMSFVKSGKYVNFSPTEENTLLELHDTKTKVESNAYLTSFRQDFEPRINSITTSGDINSLNFSESLKTEVADQIVQGAKLFLQGGKSEVKLQLNPPELGGINLEFTIVDEVLEAKISVEKSLVKDMIEKDIPRLRELLLSADIDVGTLDVTLQEKEEERQELMSKDLQRDTDSRERRNIKNGDRGNVSEEGDNDVLEQNALNSSRINYLV